MTEENQKKLESEALERYLKSQGKPEHERAALWSEFREILSRRPLGMVRQMEDERGLR